MKKYLISLITILFLLFLTNFISAQTPCPVEGSAHLDKDKIANRYKNREIVNYLTQPIDNSITLEKMLEPGDDSKRFNPDSFVKIIGYIVEIKDGGKESCNCETNVDSLKDIHIYVGLTPNADKSECVIVEVTHKWKSLNRGYNLKQYVGKQVNIYGFIFYDAEHKGNAKNTCSVCTNVWRKTVVEVHPVCKIELVK